MNATHSIKQSDDFTPGFDEAIFTERVNDAEPANLRAKRESAYAIYKETPSPTARSEEWRRTDPSLFPFDKAAVLPGLKVSADPIPSDWEEHFDLVLAIRDDAYSLTDLSGILAGKKISLQPLAEAAQENPKLIEKYLQGKALPPENGKFEALNAAFWNAGFVLHVPPGTAIEKGVLIDYHLSGDQTVGVPRFLMVVEANSSLTVVERYRSPNGKTCLSIASKEMYVETGARLNVFTLKEWGDSSYHIANDISRVEKDARFDMVTLNFGGKVNKMMFGSDVAGPGASAELDGVYFTEGKQHFDQKTWQIHSSPDTYSRLLYKGAVKDESHSVYQGVIQAKPGAIRVDSYQTNNNIVLNDGARADTIPGLLIDADDLKCSHGATIGNLDEEQIFYLRARGLSEAQARHIVILGFFDEVVDRIPFDFIKEWVHQRITEKFGQA